jgi:hypothetical protein
VWHEPPGQLAIALLPLQQGIGQFNAAASAPSGKALAMTTGSNSIASIVLAMKARAVSTACSRQRKMNPLVQRDKGTIGGARICSPTEYWLQELCRTELCATDVKRTTTEGK